MNSTRSNRAHWGSRLAFILAAAGSAIGLGNLWKFPYVAGQGGGGAFVLVYLLVVATVGIPILIAELYIGQQSQKNTVQAYEHLHKKGSFWRLPGWLGLGSAFIILSFYSVVGGWILDFEYRAILNEFSAADDETIQATLGTLLSNPLRQSLWHAVFMALTAGIVLSGIKDGLERWSKILMPALFGILIFLMIRVMFLDGFLDAVEFLFAPDFSKLTPQVILEAVGQSFFTLSLGMGAILTYGSYLSEKENLIKSAVILAALDTLMALISGVVIFSIVFTFDLPPGAGPGLIFSTLPMLFTKMAGGQFVAILFFLLVTFAAITSAVSILEVVVAYWSETHDLNRKKTTIFASLIIFSFGLLSVFSTNILADFKIFSLTFFDLFDKLTSNYMLPLGGLLISLFFGWILGPKAANKVCGGNSLIANGLLWITRVFAPIAVVAVIINLM